jgi:hypothetical protein
MKVNYYYLINHFAKYKEISMSQELDHFGKIIIRNMRDKQIEYVEGLLDGKWKAPELLVLQNKLHKLNKDQKELLMNLVEEITTNAMHDLLFELQEYHNSENAIEILVNSKNIVDLSDGIHGEIFGKDGWIDRFSSIKSKKEIDRSKQAEDWVKKQFT